jgi:ectoine hydroxylase-related dioxygenase (phytanoyl-CoA dioxygenase family)
LLWSLADPTDRAIAGVPVHQAPFNAGDAAIFCNGVLHGAPKNESNLYRRVYTHAIISSEVRYTGMSYLRTGTVGLTHSQPFDLPSYRILSY